MSHTPLFSCVIPVKGDRPFFGEAVDSLKAQGLGDDLEIIVQDADVEPDAGQSDALNKGFAKARGEWLFWLNADDVLLPGALKKVLDRINKIDTGDWIAGGMVIIDKDGKVVQCLHDRGRRCDYDGKPVRVYGPSSFFRRDLLEKCGGFDAALRYSMDTDLWCRFRDSGAWFEKVDGYIWGFRRHAASTTMGEKSAEEQSRQDAEVLAMHKNRGVWMSAWDVRFAQLRRVFDSSYARGLADTIRLRGKSWKDL